MLLSNLDRLELEALKLENVKSGLPEGAKSHLRNWAVERTFFCNTRTLKALGVYVSRGFLELVHFPLSGDQPNEKYSQKLYFMKNFDSHIRHEKIAHHDCFYKNIYDYEYISPIGKVTVPQIIYLRISVPNSDAGCSNNYC